jgi:hypothetical protein
MKLTSSLLALAMIVILLTACASAQKTQPVVSTPAAGELSQPGLGGTSVPSQGCSVAEVPVGLWINHSADNQPGNVLSLTAKGVYWVETYTAPGTTTLQTRESFSEIVEADPSVGHIKLKTVWVRVNGTLGGFDSPTWFVSYTLKSDQMQFGTSRDEANPYPADVKMETYNRQ